jgi:hypothetical protein
MKSIETNETACAPAGEMKRYVRRPGGITVLLTAEWYMEITWPRIATRPYGLQVLADSGLRIDFRARAFGLTLLGLGVAVAAAQPQLRSKNDNGQ